MEPFVTRDNMKPIIDFIASCPFAEEYGIALNPMGTQIFTTAEPDASTLLYEGSIMTSDPIDMQKTRKCNRQANYQLFLLRRSGHNIQRNYASKFLFNFEQWIEACQFHGLCPKLSNAKEFQQNEVMWADNAMPFSEWEGRVAANIYQVQLHIGYYNIYNINPMEGY